MKRESIKGKVGKSITFQEIFSEKREVEQLTNEECREYLKAYRQWVTWLPTDIIYWGSKIGEQIRIAERSGTTKTGNYVGFKVEIKEHKIEGFSREYDLIRRKYFIEKLTSLIPVSNVVDFAFISESVEAED